MFIILLRVWRAKKKSVPAVMRAFQLSLILQRLCSDIVSVYRDGACVRCN